MKPIFIISAEKGIGKTTFLIEILSLLKMNGYMVDGFLALHDIQSDFYQIKNIKTNEESLLMQRIATSDHRPHHFKFFTEGVIMGEGCIEELLVYPPDVAVVDEIGSYELAGKLWSSSFTQLVESSIPMMFTVKERLFDRVIHKWNIEPTLVFSAADFDNPTEAFKRIIKFL